ncbi:hypothetical protein GCM10009539_03010 [Cryptosporangium japonicum]|uniref:Uncharacterized protein n=1 Tax=Cryptosporangium japonicum TaxID=80872 RepID=A0ABP3D2T0_9ACTN
MSGTISGTGSTFGVLARREIRNYLRATLFWFGAALTLAPRRRDARRPDLERVLHDRAGGAAGGYSASSSCSG